MELVRQMMPRGERRKIQRDAAREAGMAVRHARWAAVIGNVPPMSYFRALIGQNWELEAIDHRLRRWAQGRGMLPVVLGYPEMASLVAATRARPPRRNEGAGAPPSAPDSTAEVAVDERAPGPETIPHQEPAPAAPMMRDRSRLSAKDRGRIVSPVAVEPRVPLGGYQSLAPQIIGGMGAVAIARQYEALTRGIEQSEKVAAEMFVARERAQHDRRLLGWRRDLLTARDLQVQRQRRGDEQMGRGRSLRH